MRLFTGIEIPEQLKYQLSACCGPLCGQNSRITAIDNIHITLSFFGEIKEDEMGKIHFACQESSHSFSPFLALPDKDFFRIINKNRGSMLFAVFSPAKRFSEISGDIYKRSGMAESIRSEFLPHATLLRSKKKIKAVPELPEGMLADKKFEINEFWLYKSTLKNSGPVYEKISIFPLRGTT
ncbi:MAG: RNA 2',3'-cyclic phosphodiesterase [Fibrobacterota bacterium]